MKTWCLTTELKKRTYLKCIISGFVGLMTVQLILKVCFSKRKIMSFEGMEQMADLTKSPKYSGYDTAKMPDLSPNDVSILSQKNANNIQAIYAKIKNIVDVRNQVDKNKTNVANVQSQVNALAEAQNDYASEMVGTEEPDISD
jgi:hypothetical protein